MTTRRHRGVSTVYTRHNLFNQNTLGRVVELQNTHIVLIKPPLDKMQVSTLSAQLGPGSELVDFYQSATSDSYSLLMFDLSPRTDYRIRYCINSGSVPSKLYVRDRLNSLKLLDDKQRKSLYSPSDPISFPWMQKSFPLVLSKRVYQVFLRMHSKSARTKLAEYKKTTRGKISKWSSAAHPTENNLEAKKRHSGVRKNLAANKSPYSLRHWSFVLTWNSLFSSLFLCTITTVE